MNNDKETLEEIVDFLINHDFSLSNKNNDGRVNSILNEEEILDIISKKFDINIPESRNWADFYINDTPINIKITTIRTADNASSKKGVYYALTGKIYNGNGGWDNYLKELSKNIKNTDDDYYFLVINKEDGNDVFFNSLKGLQIITPNGNNLPFQIQWNRNKEYKIQDFEYIKNKILSALGKGLKNRANAFISFKKYFPNIIE